MECHRTGSKIGVVIMRRHLPKYIFNKIKKDTPPPCKTSHPSSDTSHCHNQITAIIATLNHGPYNLTH